MPEEVATAAMESIAGPLLEAPFRVGTPLRDELEGRHSARLAAHWRVRYKVDRAKHAVIVHDIWRRAIAYRRR